MQRPPPLGQLAGGFAAAVLGVFPVLAGLGLIPSGDDIEPGARVLAVGIGATFVTIGLVLAGQPFVSIARAQGANSGGRIAALALSSAFAWKAADGWWGVGALLYLLMPNLIAFGHRTSDSATRVLAVSRWALKIACFMLLAATLSDGNLERADLMPVGAVYFTALALLELFRVMEIPLDLAGAPSPSR